MEEKKSDNYSNFNEMTTKSTVDVETNTERWLSQHQCKVAPDYYRSNDSSDDSYEHINSNKSKCKRKKLNKKRVKKSDANDSESKNFKCSICDKSFVLKGNLKTHYHIHKGAKPFVCAICKKGFKSKDGMLRHQLTHSGAKPFPCDICKLGFSSAVALREHKAKHNNEILYVCNICERGFRQNSCFRRHLIIHTNEMPFECELCKRRFSRSVYLRSHMLKHTGERPHACSECGKSFSHLSDLKRHKILHTGERPFKCEVCQASFADSSSKRRHERDHEGRKMYYCQLCDETFKRAVELKNHLRRKHNNPNPTTTTSVAQTNGLQESPYEVSQQSNVESFYKSSSQLINESSNVSNVTSQSPLTEAPVPSNPNNKQKITEISDCSDAVGQPDKSTVESNSTGLSQTCNTMDSSAAVVNNSRYSTELVIEDTVLNDVSHIEQIDYTIYPDFNSQDYYNWLSGFTSVCELLSLPIDADIFTKISQVHKSIADVLASPSGILSDKENFKILMGISNDLHQIITNHLNYTLEQLSN